MGITRNRLTRRFSKLGLLSDLALVGAAASRLLQKQSSGTGQKASVTELALAGGAALRLLQRFRRRRKTSKVSD